MQNAKKHEHGNRSALDNNYQGILLGLPNQDGNLSKYPHHQELRNPLVNLYSKCHPKYMLMFYYYYYPCI